MNAVARLPDRSRRSRSRPIKAVAVAALCSVLCVPLPAAADDISDLKDALRQLQQQNQELMRRITVLESEQAAQRRAAAAAQGQPGQPVPNGQAARTAPPAQPQPGTQATAGPPPPPNGRPPSNAELDQRVRELEITKAAQEDATRSIIRGAVAKTGPRINEFLSLSGAIEVVAGRTTDFTGIVTNDLILNTAELDFDIRAGEWLFGSLVLGFDPGNRNPLFPTSQAGSTAGIGVDRITVDRATITVGDPLRFPFFLRAGRDVIPFGTSTGFTRTSGLSIESPLTIQAFETRTNLVQIGVEFPTPPLTRPPPPVVPPPAQPLVLAPLVNQFANWIGYHPSGVRPRLGPVPPFPTQAPFYAAVGFYQGSDLIQGQFNFSNNFTATAGFRARGTCGSTFDELRDSLICPWSIDISADFATSIFASNFLRNNYAAFLNQIGNIPAFAANMRASFGPFSLIGEYNTALSTAGFRDGIGIPISMQPSAWQVSLGYQFNWNPWVEKIGDQGTFVAIGYSQSKDLAGFNQVVGTATQRAGFLPQQRLLMTASEWVLETLKFTVEGSIDWDYPISQGGTGGTGWGILGALTFTF